MATTTTLEAAPGETAPISLYIDLVQGARADLEVLSRAAIAWSESIREMAFIVDPSLEVRVELVSGTEGSINLNSLIRSVKATISDPKRLRAIAYAALLFLGGQVRDWSVGNALDTAWDWVTSLSAPAEVQALSNEEKKEVAAIVAKALQSDVAQKKTQQIYRELRRDRSVTGVGISLDPYVRPATIVPRAEFEERSGDADMLEEVIRRRTQIDRETVVLISPVLTDGNQKWKFQLGAKTFWAVMDDPLFKARLQPGSNHAPHMVAGIRMDVDIETVQEFREGVWTNIGHTIKNVHSLQEPQAQPDWLDAPTQEDQS